MRRMTLRRRLLSALLTAALLTAMIPAALAASKCGNSNCTGTGRNLTVTPIAVATCHTAGEIKYTCNDCHYTWTEETGLDTGNHEVRYADNGDGKTHTAECPYHDYRITDEPHDEDYDEGRCSECLAVNYDQVQVSVPKSKDVYVAVGETGAKVSMEDVVLTIGNVDITNDYNISYVWYYQGEQVGSGASYTLLDSVTEEEGDYPYICMIMAYAKSGLTARPVNATTTVTVLVRDLVVARASVDLDEGYYDLGEENGRTETSVYDQIYDAVYDASVGEPTYVVFGDKPESKVGSLNVRPGSRYSFDSADSSYLADVRFTAAGEETGTYSINFTAYDDEGETFPGVLTISVERTLGEMDLLYTALKGETVTFDTEDFADFWYTYYDRGTLEHVIFDRPSSGDLYYDEDGESIRVQSSDEFYLEPMRRDLDLADVFFEPRKSFTGTVTIPFEAIGTTSANRQTTRSRMGTIYVLITDGEVEDISYRVSTGGTVSLDGEDFLAVYQDATGSRDEDFYIQLRTLPASGALSITGESGRKDVVLKETAKSEYLFYYDSSRERQIGDLYYTAGSAAKDSAEYVVYDSKGALLYTGTILFVREDLTIEYASTSAGVTFQASDFRSLLGSGSGEAITSVTFTPPTAGTLYHNYANGTGTPVSAADKYFTTGTTLSVNSLTYVPPAGQSGQVTIHFTAYDLSNNVHTGTVEITVTATTTTPPTQQPPTTTPTVTFSDVTTSDWFYDEVMDLVNAKVINGYDDGTFLPRGEVKYGEALKMIMLAAGYSEQAPTGSHWASGYLTRALSDGLMSQSVDLERKIARNAIAEIAAKALKLPATTLTTSPFTDSSDPYVLALYEAGIVQGNLQSDGTYKYYGVNSIIRSEMAAIIWRINNYQP